MNRIITIGFGFVDTGKKGCMFGDCTHLATEGTQVEQWVTTGNVGGVAVGRRVDDPEYPAFHLCVDHAHEVRKVISGQDGMWRGYNLRMEMTRTLTETLHKFTTQLDLTDRQRAHGIVMILGFVQTLILQIGGLGDFTYQIQKIRDQLMEDEPT